jgi:hypothetical protein
VGGKETSSVGCAAKTSEWKEPSGVPNISECRRFEKVFCLCDVWMFRLLVYLLYSALAPSA